MLRASKAEVTFPSPRLNSPVDARHGAGILPVMEAMDSPTETHQEPEAEQPDFVENPREGQFYRVCGLDVSAKFTGTHGVETKIYKFVLRGVDFFVPKDSAKLLHVDELELDQTHGKKQLDLTSAPSYAPPNAKNPQEHPLLPSLQLEITGANPSQPLGGEPLEIRIALPSKPIGKDEISADNEPLITP